MIFQKRKDKEKLEISWQLRAWGWNDKNLFDSNISIYPI